MSVSTVASGPFDIHATTVQDCHPAAVTLIKATLERELWSTCAGMAGGGAYMGACFVYVVAVPILAAAIVGTPAVDNVGGRNVYPLKERMLTYAKYGAMAGAALMTTSIVGHLIFGYGAATAFSLPFVSLKSWGLMGFGEYILITAGISYGIQQSGMDQRDIKLLLVGGVMAIWGHSVAGFFNAASLEQTALMQRFFGVNKRLFGE